MPNARGSRRKCAIALCAAISAFTCLIATRSDAQGAETPIAIQAEQPVRVETRSLPDYPIGARQNYEEGWVNLTFMVSPEGKPYEAYVSDSVGSKDFQRAALANIQHWTFKPATVNGQPIDSMVSMKMKFSLSDVEAGARPGYVEAYRALNKAVDANDKSLADAALRKLHITNLYEDAYFGIAQYRYATHWGTEHEQIAALQRAIAEESNAHYLPKPLFAGALAHLLPLQVKAGDYASAMATWDRLQNAGADPKTLNAFKPMIEQMQALRDNDVAYDVRGEIVEYTWGIKLYKKRFQLDVSEGHVTDIKLLCQRRYVDFKFDASIQYRIGDQYGDCWFYAVGDPGTKLRLRQF
jgi:TonB family protein